MPRRYWDDDDIDYDDIDDDEDDDTEIDPEDIELDEIFEDYPELEDYLENLEELLYDDEEWYH